MFSHFRGFKYSYISDLLLVSRL